MMGSFTMGVGCMLSWVGNLEFEVLRPVPSSCEVGHMAHIGAQAIFIAFIFACKAVPSTAKLAQSVSFGVGAIGFSQKATVWRMGIENHALKISTFS